MIRLSTAEVLHPELVLEVEDNAVVTENLITAPERWQFQTAMILALAADALQIIVLPMFAQGALSPADDVLDLIVATILSRLIGWHWEFLPAFAAELVPGIDLVPFWTFAVVNVYRKQKPIAVAEEEGREEPPTIEGEYR